MFKSNLVENSLVKNLVSLLAGSSTVQILSLLSVPLLAQYFSPEEFGELSLLNSITAIASLIVLLSLDNAYLSESSENELSGIVQFGSLIMISVIAFVPIFIFLPIPKIIYSNGISRSIIVLLPFSIILTYLTRLNISIWNKEKLYSRISKFEVVKKSSIIFLQLLTALIASEYNGLLYGLIIGSLLPFLAYGFPIARPDNIRNLVPRILIRQKVFVVDNTLQSVLYRIISEAPVFVITLYQDLSALGVYFLATRLVQIPGRLAGNSVHRLLMGEYTTADNQRTRLLHTRFTVIILLIAIMFYLILVLLGEPMISSILGAGWESAYSLSLIIFVWTGFTLVSIPSRTLYVANRIPKTLLYWDLIMGGARLLTLYFCRKMSLLALMTNYVIVSTLFIIIFIIASRIYVMRMRKP